MHKRNSSGPAAALTVAPLLVLVLLMSHSKVGQALRVSLDAKYHAMCA